MSRSGFQLSASPDCLVMTRAGRDGLRCDAIQQEQYLHVREFGDACQRVGCKPIGERDAGFCSAPKVILRLPARRSNEPNRFDRCLHIHWRQNTGAVIRANPITFMSKGKQVLSIAAGSAIITFELAE